MRGRKRRTVTAIKPEALGIAVGGTGRVDQATTGNRKSRSPAGTIVSFATDSDETKCSDTMGV